MNDTGLVLGASAVDRFNNIYELTNGNLLKYDPNGNLLWTVGVLGKGLALDSNGNLYVAMNQNSYQYEKFSSTTGALEYTSSLTNASNCNTWAITVDSSNNLYLTGQTTSLNARVTKIYSNGIVAWDTTIPGTQPLLYFSLAVDTGFNVYASGVTTMTGGSNHIILTKFNSTDTVVTNDVEEAGLGLQVALDPYQNPYVACSGGNVLKYNSTLQLQKDVYVTGFPSVQYGGIAIDSSSNIYLNGTIQNSGSPIGSLLLRYDPNWNVQWEITNSNDQGGGSVALDGQGNIIAITQNQNNWMSFVNIRKYGSPCATPTPTSTACNNVVIYSDPLTGSGDLASNYSVYTTGGSLDGQYSTHLQNTASGLVDSAVTPTTDDLVLAKNFNNALSNYTVQVDAEQNAVTGIIGIVFRVEDSSHFYVFQWNDTPPAGTSNYWQVLKYSGGTITCLSSPYAYMGWLNGVGVTPSLLKVVCNGSNFLCYANFNNGNGDELVCQVADENPFTYGGIGLRTAGLTGSATNTFSNLQVSSCLVSTPTPTKTATYTSTFTSTFTPTNTPTPTFGCCVQQMVYGTGVAGSGNNQLNFPVQELSIGTTLFIADYNNSRINLMDKDSSANITTFTNSQFVNPVGLAADNNSTPDLFMTDRNASKVFVINSSTGALISSFNGGTGSAVMNSPWGVCANSNGSTVVVGEYGGGGRIRVFTPTGLSGAYIPIQTLAVPQGITFAPTGMRMDSIGNVYVVNGGGGSSDLILKYAYSPSSGYSTSAPSILVANNINAPRDMTVDGSGNMFVVNNGSNNYEYFNSVGQLKGSCSNVGLNSPNGIYAPTSTPGIVYIGDTANNRVAKFDFCTPTLTPTPIAGCCVVQRVYGNSTPGTSPWQMNNPVGVLLNSAGTTLYVADYNNARIDVINVASGVAAAPATYSQFVNPVGLAMDNNATPDLFMTDRNASKVFVINSSTGALISSFNGGTGSAVMNSPWGVCANSNGSTVVVGEYGGGGRIRVFTPTGLYGAYIPIQTLAVPQGITFAPTGMRMDSSANLYVANNNSDILYYPYSSSTGYSTAPTILTNSGHLNSPRDLALNGNTLYVLNSNGNYEVFTISPPPRLALAFTGSCSGSSSGLGLNSPNGITLDSTNHVCIGDTSNNRVSVFAPCTTGNGSVFKPLLFFGSEGTNASPTPSTSAVLQTTPTFTPTFTPSPSPTLDPGRVQMAAVPNVSRDGEPIRFQVNLDKSMKIELSLFTLSGEKVYDAAVQGNNGLNTLTWNLQNQGGSQVASGLYIYQLTADDGISVRTQRGKLAVIH